MAVVVHVLDSEDHELSLQGVRDLNHMKEKIQSICEIPVNQQQLVFQGKTLAPEIPIDSLAGKEITLIVTEPWIAVDRVDGDKFKVGIGELTTVSDLKRKIGHIIGLAAKDQKLVHRGKTLPDGADVFELVGECVTTLVTPTVEGPRILTPQVQAVLDALVDQSDQVCDAGDQILGLGCSHLCRLVLWGDYGVIDEQLLRIQDAVTREFFKSPLTPDRDMILKVCFRGLVLVCSCQFNLIHLHSTWRYIPTPEVKFYSLSLSGCEKLGLVGIFGSRAAGGQAWSRPGQVDRCFQRTVSCFCIVCHLPSFRHRQNGRIAKFENYMGNL